MDRWGQGGEVGGRRHHCAADAMDVAVGDRQLRIHPGCPSARSSALRVDQGDRNFNDPRLLHPQVGCFQVDNGKTKGAMGADPATVSGLVQQRRPWMHPLLVLPLQALVA